MEEIAFNLEQLIMKIRYENKFLESKKEQENSFLTLRSFPFFINDVEFQFDELFLPYTLTKDVVSFTNILHSEDQKEDNCPLCGQPIKKGPKATPCSFALQHEVQDKLLLSLNELIQLHTIDFDSPISLESVQYEKIQSKLDHEDRTTYFVEFACSVRIGEKRVKESFYLTYRASEFIGERDNWYWDDFEFYIHGVPRHTLEQLEEQVVEEMEALLDSILFNDILTYEIKQLKQTSFQVLDVKFDSYESEYLIWFTINNQKEVLVGSTTFESKCPGDIYICYDDGEPYDKENFSYMHLDSFNEDTCLSMRNHLMHYLKKELSAFKAFRLKTFYFQTPDLFVYELAKEKIE